jgi:hypothetical protein
MPSVQKYCSSSSTLMVVGFVLLTFDALANLLEVVRSFFSSGGEGWKILNRPKEIMQSVQKYCCDIFLQSAQLPGLFSPCRA